MRYRRAQVNGGTYFFTVNLAERRQSLLVEYIDVLRKVVGIVKERHPFTIDAMVIFPEHLHALWTLPPGDDAQTVDAHKNGILAAYPPRGTPERQQDEQKRMWHLATPVLGTPHPRRRGLCQTCGLHSFQSG